MIVMMSARMEEKMVARTNTRCKVATSSGAGSGLASLSDATKSEARTASPVGVNVVSCLLNFDGALVRRVRVAERDCPSRLPIVVVGFCLLEGQRRVACYIEAYAGVAGGFG